MHKEALTRGRTALLLLSFPKSDDPDQTEIGVRQLVHSAARASVFVPHRGQATVSAWTGSFDTDLRQ
jgi:hypothetical protein